MPTATVTVETGRCMWCGKDGQMTVSADLYDRWNAGELVQNVFPTMPAPEREQLVSGSHPECFPTLEDFE